MLAYEPESDIKFNRPLRKIVKAKVRASLRGGTTKQPQPCKGKLGKANLFVCNKIASLAFTMTLLKVAFPEEV